MHAIDLHTFADYAKFCERSPHSNDWSWVVPFALCVFWLGVRKFVGCGATTCVFAPRLWLLVLSSARIRKLVVRTHMRFDKPVSSMICLKCAVCVVCLVQRLYVKGGKYGCFAAVISRRKVPALDVTAREPHLFWASVSCFMSNSATFVIHGPMLVVHCHTIPYDHPCWCLFVARIVQRSFFSVICSCQGGAFEHDTQVR